MAYSTCCGAFTRWAEYDICPECRDHCDWENEIEEEELEQDRNNEVKVDESLLNTKTQ